MNVTFSKTSLTSFALLLAVAGCDCDGDSASVEIIAPAPGQVLTLADDADPSTLGLQYCVNVRTSNVGADELQLYLQAGRLADDPMALPDARLDVTEDGDVCFDTDFAPGSYRLLACADDCNVRSNEVAITVEDPCGAISFVTPAAGMDVRLGPSDNASGPGMCETFTTPVRVSTRAADGTEAQLFVNGAPSSNATVVGGVLDFGNVVLGNRGDDANTLRVELSTGVACGAEGPRIFVDCGGVSCAITRPDTGSAYLNQSDDTSMADGFQTTFELTMGANAADEATLRVNGESFTAPTMIVGDSRVATFNNLAIREGIVVVDGICTARSGEDTVTTATWTVDTVGCDIEIDAPTEDEEIIDADDVDSEDEGIQIDATGTFTGTECTAVRFGICDAMLAEADIDAGAFTSRTTLSGSAMQELCAEVEDIAGNVTEARVGIRVSTDAPMLDIVTPSTGAQFNALGAMGFTADLDRSTEECDANVVINCTSGGTVELVQMGTDALLGSATCEEMAGLPDPFTHQAMLTAPLQSRDDGSTYNIVARMNLGRLTGFSEPVEINADCAVPEISVTEPDCGSVLRPSMDDQNGAVPGLQYQVEVANPLGTGVDVVTLSVTGNPDRDAMRTPTRLIIHEYPDVTFPAGDVTIRACATDSLGNIGCSDDDEPACVIRVEELPTLTIVEPAADAVLSGDDDCNPGLAGMQVRVRATTDAADGSAATIQFASEAATATTVSGGEVNVCVDAPQGEDVPVAVTVTDGRGTVMARVAVTIDSEPPTTPIGDLAFDAMNSDRRGGVARFTFTSVADAGGSTLRRYELRCDDSAITNEAEWSAAAVFAVSGPPAGVGAMEMRDVEGFRTGVSYFCTLRAADVADALTPIGNSPAVTLPFLQQEITAATSTELGWYVAPVGSVDGDANADFIIAGNGEVWIYFGGPTLAASPTVRILGPAAFGWSELTQLNGIGIAGIGDFNADGRPDFAVGAPDSDGFNGRVYVFFGRATRDAWGTEIDTSGSCMADVCFGGISVGVVGGDVGAAGDFDGDGVDDLVIGALGESTGGGGPGTSLEGATYILRGSTMYTSLGSRAVSIPSAPAGGFRFTHVTDFIALGSTQAGMGDVTGDGLADLAFGLPGAMGVPAESYFVPGRSYAGPGLDEFDVTLERSLGTGTGGFYANLVTNIGDFDGNGVSDLAIFDLSTGQRGRVKLRAGEVAPSYTVETSITNSSASNSMDWMGVYLAAGEHPVIGTIGDLDEDGSTDVLVGSRENGAGAGSVELYYGGSLASRTRASADAAFSPTTASGGTVPRSVAHVGDINNDGFNDFVIGDPRGVTRGRAILFY